MITGTSMGIDINEHWLQQVREEVIEPDLPIVDTHFHLWERKMKGPVDYFPDDYLRDTAGHNFVGSVYVQCYSSYRSSGPEHLRPVGETEWVNAIAQSLENGKEGRGKPRGSMLASAIVGYAELSLGQEVDEVLEAHIAAAPRRMRGIRRSVTHSESIEVVGGRSNNPPHLLMDPMFREGVRRLGCHDLSYDVWIYHFQIPELVELARACPDTPIVIDHLGGPIGVGPFANRRNEVFKEWRAALKEAARCENVHIKLGGSAMRVWGFGWEQRPQPPSSDELCAATRDYYHAAIDCFSPSRCMFESNFPVDKEHVTSTVLWNSFKKIAAPYSTEEKADLFCNTAARFYRLGQLPDSK